MNKIIDSEEGQEWKIEQGPTEGHYLEVQELTGNQPSTTSEIEWPEMKYDMEVQKSEGFCRRMN